MSDPFDYDVNDALYGLLGDYVRRNKETVEVDEHTLLSQAFAVTGAAIGRRAFAFGGPSRNYPNIYTLIIGDSGVGKGGSWEVASRLGEAIDPGFQLRTAYNVASTPGLIRLVSDGVFKPSKRPAKDGKQQEMEVVVPSVKDKRLLVHMAEMMVAFTAKERTGSTLGEELRNAWDGKQLQNNSKDPERATDAHISLVGHITPVDFCKAIKDNRRDLRNGFFNRFILVRAQRERILPFYVPPPDCQDLFAAIRTSLESLGHPAPLGPAKHLDWHRSARDEWATFYTALKTGNHPFRHSPDGLCARLPVTTMRLALLQAVINGADEIYVEHLRAAKSFLIPAMSNTVGLFVTEPVHGPDTAMLQLRAKFADHNGKWTATDLHEATGGKRFSGAVLEQAAQSLVASGEWISSKGKAGNGHITDFYQLRAATRALSLNDVIKLADSQKSEDLLIEPFPDTLRHAEAESSVATASASMREASESPISFDNHTFALGCHFTVGDDVYARRLQQDMVLIRKGETGFLVQNATGVSPAERARLDKLQDKNENHRLVWLRDQLLFLPRRRALEWARQNSRESA